MKQKARMDHSGSVEQLTLLCHTQTQTHRQSALDRLHMRPVPRNQFSELLGQWTFQLLFRVLLDGYEWTHVPLPSRRSSIKANGRQGTCLGFISAAWAVVFLFRVFQRRTLKKHKKIIDSDSVSWAQSSNCLNSSLLHHWRANKPDTRKKNILRVSSIQMEKTKHPFS